MQIWRFLLPAQLWEAPRSPAVPGTRAQAACLPDGGHGAPSPTWRLPARRGPHSLSGPRLLQFLLHIFFFQISLATTQRLAVLYACSLFLWGTQLTLLPRGVLPSGLPARQSSCSVARAPGPPSICHADADGPRAQQPPVDTAAAPGPRISPWRRAATSRRAVTSHGAERLFIRERWFEQRV